MNTRPLLFRTLYTWLAWVAIGGVCRSGTQPGDLHRIYAGSATYRVLCRSGRLTPDGVLLELVYEPTFFRPRHLMSLAALPCSPLLADGRVIYTEEGQTVDEEGDDCPALL